MRQLLAVTGALLLVMAWCPAYGQDAATDGKYVSREEYEKLLKEMQAMRQEMSAMKQAQTKAAAAAPSQATTDQALDDMEKEIKKIKDQTDYLRWGTKNVYIGGDADVGFTARKHSPSTFDASLAPLVLWKLSDRLLFEGAVDIGIETTDATSSDTSVDLTIANVSYIVNNNLIVGGGLFVVPFGVFHNHYDPPWINKLPDEPLPFGDNAIAPSSEVGIFAEGAIPIGTTKFTYAAYVTNGPNLITTDPAAAGNLNFDDFTDLNNNKAVGGRVSFLPWREMEIGYSIMSAQIEPEDFQAVNAVLQAVDFEYKKEVDFLQGMIDFRVEWVWSNVGEATYDPHHAMGFGPLRFENERDGGYVQLAYRPTMVSNKIIRNFEPVFRWDKLDASKDNPNAVRDQRWTVGLDYWLMANAVLKVAYQWDNNDNGDDANAFMVQFGIGL